MSIENLKQNIETEKRIVNSLFSYLQRRQEVDFKQQKEIDVIINSLASQLKMLNRSSLLLLNGINFYKTLVNKEQEKKINKDLINITYSPQSQKENEQNLAIKKEYEKKFFEDLRKIENSKRKIESKSIDSTNNGSIMNSYVRTANSVFGKFSENLSKKSFFDDYRITLRKISSNIILKSYISLVFFSTLVSFIFSLIIGVVLFLFGVGLLISLAVLIIIPLIVFFTFYTYPSSKLKALSRGIGQELPFLTIYMSAIASSGIEPSKIFDILLSSGDYPFTNVEIKKLTNYINFYGYDLTTALRQVSKTCPSEKLGLLLDGLATTITSGGELSDFLSKHSETLLFDYRLEREKYTQIAETFMNIYISVVIAAPMILVVLLVLMGATCFGGEALTPSILSIGAILIIALINAAFIMFLNARQPKF